MVNKNKIGKALWFFLMVLFSMVVVNANPFGLDDPTVYNSTTNQCITEKNNFIITTHNCYNEDIDGQNIEQNIDFEWKGGNPLTADFIFVYEGQIEKGGVELFKNVSSKINITQTTSTTSIKEYRNVDYLHSFSDDLTSIVSDGEIIAENLIINEVIDFQLFDVLTLDSNIYTLNVTEYTTEIVEQTTSKFDWVNVNNKFNYLGNNFRGLNYDYYSAQDITLQPNKTYNVKFKFTPQNKSQNGKFHIFAKPSSTSLNNAILADQFIYQDPYWNNSWKLKRTVTVDGIQTSNENFVYRFVLNTTNFNYSYAKSDGGDIRFVDSTDTNELNYRIVSWNNTGESIFYVQLNATGGVDNTFNVYYNNSLATNNSNSSLELLTTYTNTNFTNNQTELSGGNIQLIKNETQVSNPQRSGYYMGSGTSTWWTATPEQWCQETYGTARVTHSLSSGHPFQNRYIYSSGSWSLANSDWQYTSMTCDGDYFTSGNITLTQDYVTQQDFNKFTVADNITLNGHNISGVLIYNSTEYSLSSGVVELFIPEGSNISIRYDFSGNTTTTPYMENSIDFTPTYTSQTVSSATSNIEVQNESITLLNLLNGNQTLNIAFDVVQTANQTLDYCQAKVGSTLTNGTLTGNSCSINFTTSLSSSAQTVEGYVYDTDTNYGVTAVYNLFTISTDYFDWNTTKNHTLDEQYGIFNYTITNSLSSNFTNISWSVSAVDSTKVIDVNVGSNLQSKSATVDILIEDSSFSIPSTTLQANQDYNVLKNITYNNTYAFALSPITLNFAINEYVNSDLAEYYNGSSFETLNSSVSGGNISFTLNNISASTTETYRFSYNATVVAVTIATAQSTIVGDNLEWQFNPDIQYDSNFGALSGSRTIEHSIPTSTYMPNWNTKNNWNSSGSVAHTATDNSNFLDLSFTKSSFQSETFDITYTTTVPVSVGGGGGGGGGASPTPLTVVEFDDADKDKCDITTNPIELEFNDANLFVPFTLTNRESFQIDPEFNLHFIEGDKDIFDNLQMANVVSFLGANSFTNLGVRLNTFQLNVGSATGQLIITTKKCKNVVLPIEITIVQGTTGSFTEQFEGKTLLNLFEESFDKILFMKLEKTPTNSIEKFLQKINTVGGATGVLSFITMITLLPIGNFRRFAPQQGFGVELGLRILSWAIITVVLYFVVEYARFLFN